MGLLGKLLERKWDLNEDDIRAMVKEDPKTELLDVRTAGEYRTGHINPCQNIDIRNEEEWAAKSKYLEKEKTYVLYCQSGRRSAKGVKKLQKSGFTNVYHLKGGIKEWTGAKRVK